MKRFIFSILLATIAFCGMAQQLPIVPLPVSVSVSSSDSLLLDSSFDLVYSNDAVLPELRHFSDQLFYFCHFRLTENKTALVTASPNPVGKHLVFELSNFQLPDTAGAYRLKISQNEIRITGVDRAGLFYGIQSLLQVIQQAWPHIWTSSVSTPVFKKLPQLIIKDYPRFEWRGMHLDVCRHFFPKAFIKNYIDLLAIHKMNVFHWHLTDDQGWRIEIKKYPLLTQIGGWRKGSMVGHYSDHQVDTIRHGGFYTQDDIKEIVQYASQRHITIVPEIEMPGHAVAALSAYPELSCTGGPFEVEKTWGVFDDVFCAGNEKTFAFMQDVLDEVCELFPGKYIHVGGDECPKTRWEKCPKCQQRIKDQKLKDEHGLQSYFIQRIEKHLNQKGKLIIGWDEILEGGLAPNAAVMSWRGTDGGIAAAKEKHKVVMCPGSHCYFDHYQYEPRYEPLSIGGYTPLEKVYNYEPVPAALTNQEGTYVMGAQANLWTEYIPDTTNLYQKVLPRMSALAEVLWTPAALKNEKAFMQRLCLHFDYLENFAFCASHAFIAPQVSMVRTPAGIGVHIVTSPYSQKTVSTLKPARAGSKYIPGHTPPIRDTVIPVTQSSILKVYSSTSSGKMIRVYTNELPLEVNQATGKIISFNHPPHPSYNTNADLVLVNGVRGMRGHRNGEWIAWAGEDVEMTIDLGETKKMKRVKLGLLDDKENWIYLPASVEVLVSVDNKTFKKVQTVKVEGNGKRDTEALVKFKKTKARYVRIVARNPGKIPVGAPGAGKDSWLFFDEVGVE